MSTLLDVRGIEKTYGATRALRGIDLRLERGEVVSLLGENGAGKSTLVKILSGVVTPDAGSITIDGVVTRFSTPRDALNAGIAYIPQELSAVGPLTVAENLVLGSWPGRIGVTSKRAIQRRAKEICTRTGMPLPLRRAASSLRLSELQELEIAKALARDARIILLDEPTAALSESEARHLFDLVRGLTARGVGIIFVSHRLDEVAAISDRVAVFRNGICAADVRGAETSREDLVRYMVGDAADIQLPDTPHVAGEPVLEATGLGSEVSPPVRDIAFTVRRGEVLGLYGIRGSGLSTVADILGGRIRHATGRLAIAGKSTSIPRSPRQALEAGVVYIPPDRKRGGLFPNMSVMANLSTVDLSAHSRWGLLLSKRESSAAKSVLREFEVKVRNERQNVMTLSGGNQQKVLVAGRMARTQDLLVANEPTRGVDVGARRAIHATLRSLAARDRGVMVLSSDVEEIVSVSDRVLVVRDGRLVGELKGTALTEGNVIAVAAGAPVPVTHQTSDPEQDLQAGKA